jgi:hypothetical protein
MPRRTLTFDTVRQLGLALPGVEEGTCFGAPALKVRGKMFACVPTHRSAEPESLVVRIDMDQREAMIAADPDTYYVKEHYVGYPCVLVRLSRVRRDALGDLLQTGWRFVTAQDARGPRPKTRRRQQHQSAR